jgi:pimeloyl-ACP methyl ester carboxylesterase
MSLTEQLFKTCFYKSDDNLNLFYRDYHPGNEADAVPVICLHGLTRNARDFDEIACHLAKSRRVIVPDLRGRGLSDYDAQWQNYHPYTYVDDVWQLVSALKLGKVIVIGTSLGGLMAMIMAAQKPQMLEAVILNDIGPELAPEGLLRIKSYLSDVQKDYSLDQAIARAKKINQDFFPDYQDNDWRNFVLRIHKVNAQNRYELEYDPNVFLALSQLGGLPEDPWHYFNALARIPCLLLHGELSDLLTSDIVEKMRTQKPDLQYAMVPRCGHAPFLNEPAALAAIDAFMQNLP